MRVVDDQQLRLTASLLFARALHALEEAVPRADPDCDLADERIEYGEFRVSADERAGPVLSTGQAS